MVLSLRERLIDRGEIEPKRKTLYRFFIHRCCIPVLCFWFLHSHQERKCNSLCQLFWCIICVCICRYYTKLTYMPCICIRDCFSPVCWISAYFSINISFPYSQKIIGSSIVYHFNGEQNVNKIQITTHVWNELALFVSILNTTKKKTKFAVVVSYECTSYFGWNIKLFDYASAISCDILLLFRLKFVRVNSCWKFHDILVSVAYFFNCNLVGMVVIFGIWGRTYQIRCD